MMRAMRRQDRALSGEAAWDILRRADHGVLATLGEDGYPYAVPLNHVVVGDCLYAHCALEGHKLDNVAFQDRASYCAITEALLEPEAFATAFESVIAFGRCALVEEEGEKLTALRALNARFAPAFPEKGEEIIERMSGQTAVLRFRIEHLTAKARKAGSD
jgi:uncharacterized protein